MAMELDGNIAGRLERLPFSRFHTTALLIIGLAMFFDGYDLTITGVVLPSLAKIHWTDPSRTPLFISLPLFAAAFGSIAAGVLGDWLGRRLMFRLNVLVYSLGSLACGLSTDFTMLLALRTITMFAIGTQIVTGYAYMNELTPSANRGRYQSAVALVVNSGLPVGALLAWLLVPALPVETGWRALFIVSTIPVVLVFMGRGVLPESPRWLVSVGRDAEADAVVTRIEAGYREPLPPPRRLPAPAKDLGWAALVGARYRARFILCAVFNVCHLVSIFVLVSWLPSILVTRGLGMSGAFSFAAISFTGGFAGPLIAVAIADRFERRSQVVGASIVCVVAGLVYALQTTPAGIMLFGLILVSGIFFISSVGFATYLPEILPTGVRLRGMGTAAFIGRIAAALSPFGVAALLRVVSNPLFVVAGVGGLYVLMACVIWLLGPRTSGQALETLEATAAGVSPLTAKSLSGVEFR